MGSPKNRVTRLVLVCSCLRSSGRSCWIRRSSGAFGRSLSDSHDRRKAILQRSQSRCASWSKLLCDIFHHVFFTVSALSRTVVKGAICFKISHNCWFLPHSCWAQQIKSSSFAHALQIFCAVFLVLFATLVRYGASPGCRALVWLGMRGNKHVLIMREANQRSRAHVDTSRCSLRDFKACLFQCCRLVACVNYQMRLV